MNHLTLLLNITKHIMISETLKLLWGKTEDDVIITILNRILNDS